MTDYERIDQLESDVKHLTRVPRDLVHKVRRNATAVAEIHRQSKDREWEALFDFAHRPTADREDSTVNSLRHQAAEIHRQVADEPQRAQDSRG